MKCKGELRLGCSRVKQIFFKKDICKDFYNKLNIKVDCTAYYLKRTLSAPRGVTTVAGANMYAAKLAASPPPTVSTHTKTKHIIHSYGYNDLGTDSSYNTLTGL